MKRTYNAVMVLCLALLNFVACQRQTKPPLATTNQAQSVQVSVTQSNAYVLSTTLREALVDSFSLTITGHMDGKAKLFADRFEVFELSGQIATGRTYDWFSTNFSVRYEPQGVTTGSLVIEGRFR